MTKVPFSALVNFNPLYRSKKYFHKILYKLLTRNTSYGIISLEWNSVYKRKPLRGGRLLLYLSFSYRFFVETQALPK